MLALLAHCVAVHGGRRASPSAISSSSLILPTHYGRGADGRRRRKWMEEEEEGHNNVSFTDFESGASVLPLNSRLALGIVVQLGWRRLVLL